MAKVTRHSIVVEFDYDEVKHLARLTGRESEDSCEQAGLDPAANSRIYEALSQAIGEDS